MQIKQIDPYIRDAEPVQCEHCLKEKMNIPDRAEWIIMLRDKAYFLCSFHALNSVYAYGVKVVQKTIGG